MLTPLRLGPCRTQAPPQAQPALQPRRRQRQPSSVATEDHGSALAPSTDQISVSTVRYSQELFVSVQSAIAAVQLLFLTDVVQKLMKNFFLKYEVNNKHPSRACVAVMTQPSDPRRRRHSMLARIRADGVIVLCLRHAWVAEPMAPTGNVIILDLRQQRVNLDSCQAKVS